MFAFELIVGTNVGKDVEPPTVRCDGEAANSGVLGKGFGVSVGNSDGAIIKTGFHDRNVVFLSGRGTVRPIRSEYYKPLLARRRQLRHCDQHKDRFCLQATGAARQ